MDDSGWNWTVTAYVLLSVEIKCRYPSIFDAFSSVWLSNHLLLLFILPNHFLIKEACRDMSIEQMYHIKGCEQIVRLMFVVFVAFISSWFCSWNLFIYQLAFQNCRVAFIKRGRRMWTQCSNEGYSVWFWWGCFNRGVFLEVYTIISSSYQGSTPHFA